MLRAKGSKIEVKIAKATMTKSIHTAYQKIICMDKIPENKFTSM
jgi:hypothetical protein